jgi:hypothetical protein
MAAVGPRISPESLAGIQSSDAITLLTSPAPPVVLVPAIA